MTAAAATIEDYYTDPFPGRKGSERIVEACGKCSGTGVVDYGRVTLRIGTVEDRFCFDCGGSGKYSYLVSSRRASLRAAARRRVAADAAAAEAIARREAFAAAHAELLADLAAYAEKDAFLRELHETVVSGEGTLTEGQLAAIPAAVDRVKAREAAKRPVPVSEKRQRVEGIVRSKKLVEHAYGSSLKMLVECEGFKLYGTLPSALYGVETGEKVAFDAKVEASSDDESFGFFSRPTKVERLG